MKLVGEDRGGEHRSADLDLALISVHSSPSYDLIVSLRALYNTDNYKRARQWAPVARRTLGPGLYSEGRLFFEGGETALGYGLLPLVSTMGAQSGTDEFIKLLRATPNEECALLMLNTGETSQEAMDFYRSVLEHAGGQQRGLETEVRRFAGDFADRSLKVLRDPAGVKNNLVRFLERYHDMVFAPMTDTIGEVVERAAISARDLLDMRPTLSSVEALTGGYTLSAALRMDEIILAPSVFIYPFMASRVDERTGHAFILFGVKNDEIIGYRESNSEDVLDSVKALANPQRLQILALLLRGPLLGSEFVKALELSQPTVHHHFAQLRSSGLIRQERTPDGMLYSFRPDAAVALVDRLAHFLGVD